MSAYVTLVGAEDVRSAANTMQSAANTMGSAASSIAFALEQHQRFMDDWLQRFDGLMQDRIHDLGVTLS